MPWTVSSDYKIKNVFKTVKNKKYYLEANSGNKLSIFIFYVSCEIFLVFLSYILYTFKINNTQRTPRKAACQKR